MTKQKVKLDFIELPIPQKIEYTRDRVIGMTGNTNFTTPDVPLATLTANADDLEDKYNAAQGGGPAATIAQDASRKVLDDNMRKEAAYVDRIADGDPVIISSGGWTPSKAEKVSVEAPGKPGNVTLEQTKLSGTIISNCNPVEGAKAFVTILSLTENPAVTIDGDQLTVSPGEDFIILHVSTSRKAIHTGLKPTGKYYVRKYALNAAGRGPNSDVISMIVI